MHNRTLALIIEEGTRVVSTLLRNRDLFTKPAMTEEGELPEIQPSVEVEETPNTPDILPEKATSVASGCVPCAIGHFSTCTGILNEAMRFAPNNGIGSDEVIERINICVDELNGLERIDLRPEMIANLPEWEKKLAHDALDLSRSMRHKLESIEGVYGLENAAAQMQSGRQKIGTAWFKERLSRMTPEQRENMEQKLEEVAK